MRAFYLIKEHYKSRKNIILFFSWVLLRIKKVLKIGFIQRISKEEEIVDIVIPTISKDHQILELLLKSLTKLNHKINNIYIVAPDKQEIKGFCSEAKLHIH